MREIKFRVFNKENKIMLGWDYLLSEPDFEDFMKHAHKEDVYYSKMMQYTGLKDKNGVDIYEDDVIEVRDELYPFAKDWIGTVKMNCGSYLIETLKDANDNIHYDYLFNDEQELTVKGNIYENPELLVVVE